MQTMSIRDRLKRCLGQIETTCRLLYKNDVDQVSVILKVLAVQERFVEIAEELAAIAIEEPRAHDVAYSMIAKCDMLSAVGDTLISRCWHENATWDGKHLFPHFDGTWEALCVFMQVGTYFVREQVAINTIADRGFSDYFSRLPAWGPDTFERELEAAASVASN